MPQQIDEIMAEAQASLFPAAAKDLVTACSCPDSANPCKHVAAVHYLLAEEIDRDPFLLFTLRGRDREAVMRGLRQARGAEEPPAEAAPAAPAEEPLQAEGFWEIGPAMADWRVALAPPAVPGAVLRRLGPPDFAEDPQGLQSRFQQIYARVTDRALETGLADFEPPPDTSADGAD
jgi:uncharacterized Zn finger protein